jgi:hypothetical protein
VPREIRRSWRSSVEGSSAEVASFMNATPLKASRSKHVFVQTSRAMGLACIVAVIVLSLLPGNERPHTGLSWQIAGQLEHVVAYFGTAAFLAIGFRTMKNRALTFSLLVGLAAVLEITQRLIPGRHSQFVDLVASSLGAGLGILAVVLMERLMGLSAESE